MASTIIGRVFKIVPNETAEANTAAVPEEIAEANTAAIPEEIAEANTAATPEESIETDDNPKTTRKSSKRGTK